MTASGEYLSQDQCFHKDWDLCIRTIKHTQEKFEQCTQAALFNELPLHVRRLRVSS